MKSDFTLFLTQLSSTFVIQNLTVRLYSEENRERQWPHPLLHALFQLANYCCRSTYLSVSKPIHWNRQRRN